MRKLSQFELTKYIFENVNKSNSGLDTREYILLLQLSHHLNSTTLQCNPSKELLADEMCMGERTVDEALKGLVAKGFVTYKRGYSVGRAKKSNEYVLVLDKIFGCVKDGKPTGVVRENKIEQPVVAKPNTSRQVASDWYDEDIECPF